MAGCGRETPQPTPAPTPSGEVLRFGYPSEPPTLDPLDRGGASSATRDILRPVLPALFGLDARLRPIPELAAGWPTEADFSLDPFSVTLRLRRASWSDGRPITSEDVRFSFERLREGPTGYRYRFLQEVEIGDPASFTLRFDRPVRRWWALFSLDDMVLPAHAYSEEWKEGPTLSGGPFLIESWTEGLRIRLVRNESHWGPPATLAGIDVLFVPDDETRFQLLERGEIDAFFSEGDVNIGRRAAARGHEAAAGALDGSKGASWAWGPTWWELNLLPGLGAGNRAVVEALDPDLVGEIFEDSGAPMNGIPAAFPVPGGAIDGSWTGRGDLAQARRLLASRASFELAFARGSGGGIAAFIHFRLRELGVRVELVGLEGDAFERALDGGEVAPAFLRLRRGADAPDAGAYVSGLPGSAPVDEDVEAAEATFDPMLIPAPVTGLDAGAWRRAQEGLQQAATTSPLARVRTWIVGADGVWGPHALGTSSGPLWNASLWRFTNPR